MSTRYCNSSLHWVCIFCLRYRQKTIARHRPARTWRFNDKSIIRSGWNAAKLIQWDGWAKPARTTHNFMSVQRLESFRKSFCIATVPKWAEKRKKWRWQQKWEQEDWFAPANACTLYLHFMLQLILMNGFEVKQQLQLFMWTIYVMTTNKQTIKQNNQNDSEQPEYKKKCEEINSLRMCGGGGGYKCNILPINLCWRCGDRGRIECSDRQVDKVFSLVVCIRQQQKLQSKLINRCVCCVQCMLTHARSHMHMISD